MCTCPGCIEEAEKLIGMAGKQETLGFMLRNLKETPLKRGTYITKKGTVIRDFYSN